MAVRHDQREVLSKRAVRRIYGFDPTEAIDLGEIPASRVGKRRLSIFRADVEAYIRKHAIRPTDHAEARVNEVLKREARVSAG